MRNHLLKSLRRPVVITALLGALTLAAVAGDDSFDRLVAKWKVEREQILRRMTQAWLQGEKPESMKGDLVTLAQIESGLATKPGATLYLSQVEDTQDLNATVGQVVRAYLKQRGATVNTAEFMRGKSFSVLREEPPASPEENTNAKPAGSPKGRAKDQPKTN